MACCVLSAPAVGIRQRRLRSCPPSGKSSTRRRRCEWPSRQLGLDQTEIAYPLCRTRCAPSNISKRPSELLSRRPGNRRPSEKRPTLSVLNATMWPRPISCSRFSFGTGEFSKKIGIVELPLDAHLFFFRSGRKSGRAALDDEAGEFLAVHFGEHDVDVRESAVRDPHLLPVQNPVLAVGRQAPRACERQAHPNQPAARRGSSRKEFRRWRSSADIFSSALRCRNKRWELCRCRSDRRGRRRRKRSRTVFRPGRSRKSCRDPRRRILPESRRRASRVRRLSSAAAPSILLCAASSSGICGTTSFATNSSAVWPISRWSSVRSAGVKTSAGRCS